MKLLPALLAVGLSACFIQQPTQPGGTYAGGSSGGTSAGGGDGTSGGGDPYANGGDGSGGGAAASGPVYVDIRSACPDTVPVFYGSDPGYGSGTESSIESNSVSSYTFNPGDMFWITDGNGHGVASVTVSANTHELEIDASCTSIHEN
jgi:hypothetical protein